MQKNEREYLIDDLLARESSFLEYRKIMNDLREANNEKTKIEINYAKDQQHAKQKESYQEDEKTGSGFQ